MLMAGDTHAEETAPAASMVALAKGRESSVTAKQGRGSPLGTRPGATSSPDPVPPLGGDRRHRNAATPTL